MTSTPSLLKRSLICVALAAVIVPGVADASQVRGGKRIVGRITAISASEITVGSTTLKANAAQLAKFAKNDCVEVKAKRRGTTLRAIRIKPEDSCAPMAPAAGGSRSGGADDPANHDAGDDRGTHAPGADDPANHDAGDDHGNGGHGADDPADHDANDDHGNHGGGHA